MAHDTNVRTNVGCWHSFAIVPSDAMTNSGHCGAAQAAPFPLRLWGLCGCEPAPLSGSAGPPIRDSFAAVPWSSRRQTRALVPVECRDDGHAVTREAIYK